ncbi:MAG: hypothetical protein ABIR70_04005 [Bryobacteraceae bacterium]
MELDLEQLRRQYAELTDEALLEIDASDLVDAAQQCYQAELRQRGIRTGQVASSVDGDVVVIPDQGEPEWLDTGIVVMSLEDSSIVDARSILNRAAIPCFVVERAAEGTRNSSYDLLVPPGQHLLAVSILDRDYFNPRSEEDWKAEFAGLTDDELMDIDADILAVGLRDRVDRLVRAYEDELLKRGLAELETE